MFDIIYLELLKEFADRLPYDQIHAISENLFQNVAKACEATHYIFFDRHDPETQKVIKSMFPHAPLN